MIDHGCIIFFFRNKVLESSSDVEAWKMEVERVIPRLKLAAKSGPLIGLPCTDPLF